MGEQAAGPTRAMKVLWGATAVHSLCGRAGKARGGKSPGIGVQCDIVKSGHLDLLASPPLQMGKLRPAGQQPLKDRNAAIPATPSH